MLYITVWLCDVVQHVFDFANYLAVGASTRTMMTLHACNDNGMITIQLRSVDHLLCVLHHVMCDLAPCVVSHSRSLFVCCAHVDRMFDCMLGRIVGRVVTHQTIGRAYDCVGRVHAPHYISSYWFMPYTARTLVPVYKHTACDVAFNTSSPVRHIRADDRFQHGSIHQLHHIAVSGR